MNHIDGAFYLDANLTYKFHIGESADAEVFLNVRNLANKDPVVVAMGPGGTTFNAPPDNPSLYDVLGRVCGAINAAKADICVEITGDCPLSDPAIVSAMIREFHKSRGVNAYISNVSE